MGFERYNVKAHNQVLGQLRTDKARRRNEAVLAILRAHVGALPTDADALRGIVKLHHGRLPASVLLKLARQVRGEQPVQHGEGCTALDGGTCDCRPNR